MLRAVLLFGLLAAPMAAGFMGPGNEAFCQRNTVETAAPDVLIECGAGLMIKVVDAYYGRDSTTECPYSGTDLDQLGGCKGPRSKSKIRKECNGETSCTFPPTTEWFNWDDCMGTYKYVYIDFECVDMHPTGRGSNVLNTFTACENQAQWSLDCDSADDEIVVYSAKFGRTSDDVCGDPSVTTEYPYNCVSDHSDRIVGLINGRKSFNWQDSGENYQTLFGTAPCAPASSYLKLIWMCKTTKARPATPEDPTPPECDFLGPGASVTCERNTRTPWEPDVTICCPLGQEIKITRAFYGRDIPATDFCPYPWVHADIQDCSAEGSQDKIEEMCESENNCTIQPTNAFFGDPCVGTYKLVYIQFECISPTVVDPAPTHWIQKDCFCHDVDFVIGCQSPNDVLHVVMTKYGRHDRDRCFDAALPTTDYQCRHDNSSYMSGYASGRNSMSFNFDYDAFFGPDPDCNGLYPYMCIKWCCRPMCLTPFPYLNWGMGFFCERNTVTLWKPDVKLCCPAGKVIKVHHGFYGRYIKDPYVCPYHTWHINSDSCSDTGADMKIKNHCDGNNMCTFPPTNAWFGNDPCLNTYKYVFVKFCCVDDIPAPPPPPPCYCTIKSDPLVTTFDSEAISIDLTNGDNMCDLVNTLSEVADTSICRYRVKAIFDTNHYPSQVYIEIIVPGDSTAYQFHLPDETADVRPNWVYISSLTGSITATSYKAGCTFEFTIEFGTMPRIVVCLPSGDPNMLACHGGLCGQCDNVFNDYTLRNGTSVAHLNNKFALLRDSFCSA